jgi:hypothetical protein
MIAGPVCVGTAEDEVDVVEIEETVPVDDETKVDTVLDEGGGVEVKLTELDDESEVEVFDDVADLDDDELESALLTS